MTFKGEKFRSLVSSLLVACAATTSGGCISHSYDRSEFASANVLEENQHLVRQGFGLSRFQRLGDFSVSKTTDHMIWISREQGVSCDIYIPSGTHKAPVVVIQHGNESFKEAHSDQAQHLASWGFIVVTTQLPNEGQWIQNGITLAKFTKMIHQWPALLSPRVDKNRIIVVGHSFGGSAAALAAANDAPAMGIILLDPAIVSADVNLQLKHIDAPVALLGADPTVFRSRKRESFFSRIRSNIMEISIRGSTHDDATSPSLTAIKWFGIDPAVTVEHQKTFSAALLVSVISMTQTKGNRLAWNVFQPEVANGVIRDGRIK
jgi:dienelactone hydrolase